MDKDPKRRGCKACHEVQAGNQDKHVRDEVESGTWVLPIHSAKTKTGGTCVVGCPKPKK